MDYESLDFGNVRPPDEEIVKRAFGTISIETLKVGDKVVLPTWYRLRNRQRRVSIVSYIHEAGGFIFLVAMKRNGEASEDRRTGIYWPVKKVSDLREYDR